MKKFGENSTTNRMQEIYKGVMCVQESWECRNLQTQTQTQTQGKNRTQVQKVHQVKIENRRFSFKQQYFQVLLRQSPPNVMLYGHFTTRLHRTYNH